jgi:mannose-6-phosphate isomerase-like protein (cupin superfamily)
MSSAVSIPQALNSFDDLWSPRLVASVNNQHVKIAKINGSFIWHSHPDSDELFYVLEGRLTLEIENEHIFEVAMSAGDMYTVPRGVRHRPVAENAKIMMVEQAGTVNTGDAGVSALTRTPEDIRRQELEPR